MSKEDANINNDLQRWLRGDANMRDEGRLDQQAQDDPFLADALEGYRKFPQEDHEASTNRIKQKLRKRTKTGRRSQFLRIAAAIVFMLMAASAIVYLQRTEQALTADAIETNIEAAPLEEPTMLQAEKTVSVESEVREETPSPTVGSPEVPIQETAEITDDQILQEEKQVDLAEAEAPPIAQAEPADDGELEDQAPPSPARSKRETSFLDKDQDTINSVARPAPRQIIPNQLAQSAKSRGERPIFGLILDAMGDPLVGATISILDTELKTITDIKGEFEMLVDSTEHVMQIDYIGYNSLQVGIPAGGAISERFTLDDEALVIDEVQLAIDGLSSSRIKKLEPIAEPIGGRAAYRRYIRDNAARGLPKGRVRLRFKIDADGQPYDIHVDKSNNPVLNSSAMSLLLKGPKWNIVQGIPPIDMTYTVRFR